MQPPIKIIAYLADSAGCGWYRLISPLKMLERMGKADVRLCNYINEETIQWGDIAIFQRQTSAKVFDYFIKTKKLGKKTILELDDYLHGVPASNPAVKVYTQHSPDLKILSQFIREADACTFSTPGMKRLYGNQVKKVYIIPNCIDFSQWASIPFSTSTADSEIRIGWAGTATHLDDLKEAADALNAIAKECKNVKLVFFGYYPQHMFMDLGPDKVEAIKGVWDNNNLIGAYSSALVQCRFTIGIAPLVDNAFNKCKSNLKFLEYSASQIPCVASKVEPYAISIKHGENGFLCTKYAEWYKTLKKLVSDNNLRDKIRYAAYENCQNNFSLEKNWNRWYSAYIEILEGK